MDSNRDILTTLREEVIEGDMSTFKSLYGSYKEEFKKFALRYTQDDELVADSYHDAFIALYENIIEGKLTELSSSLKTYVFSIGKYTLFNKLRKEGKTVADDDYLQTVPADETAGSDDERFDDIRKQLNLLGERCREILILFYYHRYTIDAIVRHMEYKNENTAKAHKSRCLKKLRENLGQTG